MSNAIVDWAGRPVKCADCGRVFTHPNQYKYRYGPMEKAGRNRYPICRRAECRA